MRTAGLLASPCLYKWYKHHLYNRIYVCIPIRSLTVEESGPEPSGGSGGSEDKLELDGGWQGVCEICHSHADTHHIS